MKLEGYLMQFNFMEEVTIPSKCGEIVKKILGSKAKYTSVGNYLIAKKKTPFRVTIKNNEVRIK